MRLLFILFVFITISCKTTEYKDEFRNFSQDDEYNWKDCVIPNQEYLEKEVPKIRKHFNEYIANIDSIEKLLHFIDLNNDNNLDVIYSGTSGSASDYVVFLLNSNNDYRILYEEFTNIRELIFDKNRLVSYTGLDFGCCAEYVQKETKYLITENLERIVVYQRAKVSYTELPDTIFRNPIKFIVLNDTLKLRSSPVVDDKNMFIYDTVGNVVSAYLKGSKGKAWSEKIDLNGQVWWFVEMEHNKNQICSKLNYKSDTLPVRNLGWFNSKYLEKVK